MAEVTFYDSAEDALLKFAVIIARTDGKWIFCKHRERDTYEVPGEHREKGEDILSAAKRELMEETGAVDFTIKPICVYSVKGKTRASEGADDETFGMLFAAEVFSFEEIHSEIEKILITGPSGGTLDLSANPAQTDRRSKKQRFFVNVKRRKGRRSGRTAGHAKTGRLPRGASRFCTFCCLPDESGAERKEQ